MRRIEAVLFLAREPLSSRKLSQYANLADGTEARTVVRRLNERLDALNRAFRIREVGEDNVVADFNHPLAGQRLHFDVKVDEVRQPTAEELSSLMTDSECSPSACSSCGGGCG